MGVFGIIITNPFQIYDLHQFYKLYNPIILSSYLNRKGEKMENQYLNQPEETNLYDEPSDDELQRIENEILDFLD